MSEQDYNPFVFQKSSLLDSEEITPTIASSNIGQLTTNPQAIYTQEEYDKIWAQYQQWKTHSQHLEETLLALADLLYESLAFINAGRLYSGKPAVMLTDIANACENNTILTQMSNELRQAAIESGYGIISEMHKSQDHLKETVMQRWIERFHSDEREALSRELLISQPNTPPPDADVF